MKILPNLRRKEVLTLLSKAKVLFHPMPDEHFGIAVVEAMTSGLFTASSRIRRMSRSSREWSIWLSLQ